MSDGGSRPATASCAAAAHVASAGCWPARAASAFGARTGVGPMPDRAMRASATIPFLSVRSIAATPAMAKSPLRRLNSWNDHPVPGCHAGKRTAVRSSSGASDVVRNPWKRSAAGTVRTPRALLASTSPSRASSTEGSSAAGSAWAMLPPIVPRLRMALWPIRPRARTRSGLADATCSERSATRWRTRLPTARPSPLASDVRASTPLMSTRWAGRARRRASSGTRLCPPARTLASSPCSPSRATASSTDATAWYSKGGGFTRRTVAGALPGYARPLVAAYVLVHGGGHGGWRPRPDALLTVLTTRSHIGLRRRWWPAALPEPVVEVTSEAAVRLGGRAALGVGDDVVDLAAVGGDVAVRVSATPVADLDGPTGGA